MSFLEIGGLILLLVLGMGALFVLVAYLERNDPGDDPPR